MGKGAMYRNLLMNVNFILNHNLKPKVLVRTPSDHYKNRKTWKFQWNRNDLPTKKIWTLQRETVLMFNRRLPSSLLPFNLYTFFRTERSTAGTGLVPGTTRIRIWKLRSHADVGNTEDERPSSGRIYVQKKYERSREWEGRTTRSPWGLAPALADNVMIKTRDLSGTR